MTFVLLSNYRVFSVGNRCTIFDAVDGLLQTNAAFGGNLFRGLLYVL